MFPASFGYVAAHSVEEALELLTKHGEDAKLLAGGDADPMLAAGRRSERCRRIDRTHRLAIDL